jgi:hypothetical protein
MKDRLHWVPSFVTGAASATTATVAVALLLYSGEGMLRSLILIVAFELAALGLGLGFGVAVPTTRVEALVSLRRRWLSVLVAFLAASIFVLAWLFKAGFGARAGTQALGLALLAGLPLYTGGQLLAAISADGSGRGGGGVGGPVGRRVGAFATLGACAGVLVTGLSGLGRVGVPSLMFFMLMALSGAALVQGWLLRDEASPAVVGRESGGE